MTTAARRTGATDAQIEAAMRSDWDCMTKQAQTKVAQGEGFDGFVRRRRWWYAASATKWAAESDRIVPVSLLERAAEAIDRGDILPALRAELLAAIGGGE